ncbi:putative proteinC DOMAIN-CONTAINING PROTEIN 102-LIKE [Salix purpurea]|uniref:NAC domain-containing protein n=1 Tax=Salix purpurea TaxID=77065 RepID=A0A9Q0VX12_SALPP|nr:putative proteinC DOMAIN-CONTAINING PROTEIN 102-LIKE [Salix purpurea]
MQPNNGRSGMPSSSNSSGKKMKVAGSNYESNSNDIQFGANILNNASSCMFPDRFSPPNNAMIAPYSPPNFVNRLHQPQHRVNGDVGNYIDPYFRTFPPGMRFWPKDKELVVYYLMKKIRNEPLPKNRIHEVNIYDYHPKTLAEKYKLFQEDAWYFFTTRLKKYPKGKIPDRGVPGGFWKPTGSPETVPAKHSNIAIERRSLDFYEGKGNTGRRTEWKMHEYYPKTDDNVSSTNTEGMRLNDCVLCRIYLKGGKQQADAKTTCNNKSRNDGNSVSHGSADSRNDDHTSSDNINSQQPANHGASDSDTTEVYDETQSFYDYSMHQRWYADSSNHILASMDPAMYTLPDSRNDDHTSSDNINSQQPANHGASDSDTTEVYDETQSFYDYSMHQRWYADSSNHILASMDPAMYTLPDSRNDDHTSSDNINSQQPANHGASASDTTEVYDETQAFYDYSMDQRWYADSSNQILASMDPAMYAFPDAIEGTSRGFSQSVAFAGPSSSMPLTMNVAGMINGPSFSMPLTMHGAGLNGATSSMPLTMHVAGLNGATSSMHGAGLNGANSSKPPTTLPGNTMDADDHLVEFGSLLDDAFTDDNIARILEMFQQENTRINPSLK